MAWFMALLMASGAGDMAVVGGIVGGVGSQ